MLALNENVVHTTMVFLVVYGTMTHNPRQITVIIKEQNAALGAQCSLHIKVGYHWIA
jgi:hypothetical protein